MHELDGQTEDLSVDTPRITAQPFDRLPDDGQEDEQDPDADGLSDLPATDDRAAAERSGPSGGDGGGQRSLADQPVTAWSAMSRARSMTSNPSASCSSVMQSGGFV